MMDPKLKYWVFDRKEGALLFLIIAVVGALAFTVGVHYGKQYALPSAHEKEPFEEPAALKTQTEKLPQERDLDFHAKDAARKAQVSIEKSLQEEVVRTGIKLEKPLAVDLPRSLKKPQPQKKIVIAVHHAPEPVQTAPEVAKQALQSITQDAMSRALPEGKYTLQIGVYQKMEDTRDQLKAFESLGIKPTLRVSKTSFRLYHGGFSTTNEAEDAGKALLNQGKIESFVVVNRPSDRDE